MGHICDGERGERGERGHRGKRGHRGERGDRGHDGPTGPTGATGFMGSTGATGGSGATGPTGATGATGAGSAPTGDLNTQAYFGPIGALTDDVDATMTLTDWQLKTSLGGPNAAHVDRVNRSLAVGQNSVALSMNSFAAGNGSSANTSDSAFASGISCSASGAAAHAEGNTTVASGAASHAEGSNCTASGPNSHAEGQNTTATNVAAHAEGRGNTCNGDSSHAEGFATLANGAASHAEGTNTTAASDWSHAHGHSSVALRETQEAYASGVLPAPFSSPGSLQTSRLVLRGQTPGAAFNETAELLFGAAGTTQLILEDQKVYTFRAQTVVGGNALGTQVGWSQEIVFGVRRIGGVSTIFGQASLAQFGDAQTATFSLVPSIGVAPDRVVLTFSTGGGLPVITEICTMLDFQEAPTNVI